jgi:hypothetical protein
VGAIVSAAITLSLYVIVVAAVWKLFRIGDDLGEIKNMLADFRKTSIVERRPISLESAEALLREVGTESTKTTV